MAKGHTKQLAKTIDASKRDTDERVHVLRLQAMAWRILTMIALMDQEQARIRAQWLLFQTVPFTNGPEVEKFIAENQTLAEEYGIKAGVFTARKTAA